MISLTLNQTQFKKLIDGLNEALADTDYSKPIKQSLDLFKEEIAQNFDQQGRSYARGSWEPLAAPTVTERARKGYGGSRPILERSGTLRHGFVITEIGKKDGKIANRVPYASFHQTGTRRMPARPIIGLTRKMRSAVGLVFAKHINGQLKRYFR